jgi:hypothetical protein
MTSPRHAGAARLAVALREGWLAKAAKREIKEGQNKKRKLSYEKPDKQS